MDASIAMASGAATVAFVHTLAGPDHYVPFIAIGTSMKWRWPKVVGLTLLCGLGHVLSSLLLGLVGATAGAGFGHLEGIQESAGAFAGWSLVALGGAYLLWGIWRSRKPHTHKHSADTSTTASALAPWALFLIFAFGPCEPLIAYAFPLGLAEDWTGLLIVSVVFSVVTLVTMVAVVLVAHAGLVKLKSNKWHRYSHAIAGGAILLSGLAITVLGL